MTINKKEVKLWDYTEIIIKSEFTGNPFKDIILSATFINDSEKINVTGFYDGNNIWKIRFMPTKTGVWTFETKSSLDSLSGHKDSITCIDAAKGVHGPVRVSNKMHFAYEDGTPFYLIGTTCYVWNLQGEKLEKQTLDALKDSPFNKIRFCVFPKRYTFNYNEPEMYPFPGKIKEKWKVEYQDDYTPRPRHSWWDYDNFNTKYFKHLDECILKLMDLGIEADLILFHPYDFGAWGFDSMPEEVNMRLLNYLVARLSAFRNIWWSFANEFDFVESKTVEEWDRYIKLVEKLDPYNHLRSIHNAHVFFDHSKPWITHCSIQSSDFNRISEWFKKYQKPIVIDECGYEGNIDRGWGNLTGKEMVNRFWLGFAQGAYVGHGETYINPENNLWWSKGGSLVGSSPERIDFLKKVIEEIPIKYHSHIVKSPKDSFIYKTTGCGVYPEYGLIYFGRSQPAFQNINLPKDGTWQIAIIDSWEMTITNIGDDFSGSFQIKLPEKECIALRIQRVIESK